MMPTEQEKTPATIQLRALLEARKQKENLRISELRKSSTFSDLLERFVDGQSVLQVATWVYCSKPEGPLKNAAFRTIRQYLTILRARVCAEIASHSHKPHEQSWQGIGQTLRDEPLAPLKEEDDTVEGSGIADRAIDATTVLKYSFMIQQSRLKEMLEPEERTSDVPHSDYREIRLMRNIADTIRRCEIGQDILRNESLPDAVMPPKTEMCRDMAEFAKFDAVDRNLARAACENYVSMTEGQRTRFEEQNRISRRPPSHI
jgi:hypothetical protein